MMTVRDMVRTLTARLAPAVGEDEARAMAREMVCAAKGYANPSLLVINGDHSMLDETVGRLLDQAERIAAGAPMQYVLGQAWFHGRLFKVTPDVLIPRPETSQLVDIVTDDLRGRADLRVLDVGTGSGCIAVSLALDLPFSRVTAVDVSDAALRVAEANAGALGASIETIRLDILTEAASLHGSCFDCIVSNPPYVLESERASMDARVSAHEPGLALFVPDNDPIVFYEAIARLGLDVLADDGRLYFEINPLCAGMVTDMLSDFGYRDAEAMPDYKGNVRFVKASRP